MKGGSGVTPHNATYVHPETTSARIERAPKYRRNITYYHPIEKESGNAMGKERKQYNIPPASQEDTWAEHNQTSDIDQKARRRRNEQEHDTTRYGRPVKNKKNGNAARK